MTLTLSRFVAAVAVVLVALDEALILVPVAAVTHAPPPWSSRLARAVPAPAPAGHGTEAEGQAQGPQQQQRGSAHRVGAGLGLGLGAAGPLAVPQQVQLHLQQLQQLSRSHLESWAGNLRRRLQQPQQQPEPHQVQGQQPQGGPRQPPAATSGATPSGGEAEAEPTGADQAGAGTPDGDREQEAPPAATTTSPEGANEVDSDRSRGPSNCVWAIVTCCQPQTAEVRYQCFELLGCPGAFWDGSPCDPEVTSAALSRASKFYSSKASASAAAP